MIVVSLNSNLDLETRFIQKWTKYGIRTYLFQIRFLMQSKFFFIFPGKKVWNYRGVPHETVSFGYWLTHIRVQHLILGSTSLDCHTWSRDLD